ncbi:MAG TPA: glycosyltransferase family 4 protein [Pyrinomonadaceae bacterium]|jgi:glycosyltransferase involved in cell wall biosynthesis|nr:glycosyltransferase family 4 protein [Pyrinomonadaceae bacterium]
MRVLHIHSGNLYGGVETLLVTLARHRHLCPAMEPHFALCFDGRLHQELKAAAVPVELLGQVRIRKLTSVLKARRRLRALLRDEKFDAVVCHSSWSQALFGPVARDAQVPLVFWLHNIANGRHWLERLGRRTPPDLALCNSKFTAATLGHLYPHVHGEIFYYPVAPPSQTFNGEERAATRAEFQTPADATVIIQTSRMEAWKGQALHLEALGLLKDVPGWVSWQIGGAQRPEEMNYVSELKKRAIELGISDRVRFVGQRVDVSRLLAAADIHCQPNLGPEPFGIAFIEALYARLPVVTTSIGGACEIVDDSCGVLVPAGEASALAASLRNLIEDQTLRLKLGANGPSRASSICYPSTQMAQLKDLLAMTAQREAVNA